MRVPLLSLAVLAVLAVALAPAADAWVIQSTGLSVGVSVFDRDGRVRPCAGVQYEGSGVLVDTTDGVMLFTGQDAPRYFLGYSESGTCPSNSAPLLP